MAVCNRVALVTGCGRKMGIGAAAARALAASGVSVVVTSIARQSLAHWHEGHTDPAHSWGVEALADEIAVAGGTASWARGDVSNEVDAAYMVGEALKRYDRLDILVNNAGAPQGRERVAIEEVPLEAWERVMAINARGVFLMCRAAVTPMRKQGWGRIINISSSVAKIGGKNRAVYSASKAAVIGFTHSLGIELAPYGITVNALCPGPILTDRALSAIGLQPGQDGVDAALAESNKRIPVGRHGRPEEVAAMIAFLASEQSGFVTGQAISVCGGLT